MEKNRYVKKILAVGIILLFICCSIVPECAAQDNQLQKNRTNVLQDENRQIKSKNNDNESFFNFAIIWGTFEHKSYSSLFGGLIVMNRDPWYNRTMYVIGYQIPQNHLVIKKSYWIECHFVHIGFVGRNRLFVIGIGNVAAF